MPGLIGGRSFLSIACELLASAFWAGNLSITFPIARVLFEADVLHTTVAREIDGLKSKIRSYQESLQKF
jgi:hypothetical protein